MRGIIEIERPLVVGLALVLPMKRRDLVREVFHKPPHELWLLCAKLLLQHKAKRSAKQLPSDVIKKLFVYSASQEETEM